MQVVVAAAAEAKCMDDMREADPDMRKAEEAVVADAHADAHADVNEGEREGERGGEGEHDEPAGEAHGLFLWEMAMREEHIL